MQHLRRMYRERWWRHFLSAPVIYSVIVPVIFLDLLLELYHRVCFPLYGIAYVRRREYIRIDRHRLSYLNLLQKVNCAYCGYVNGFLAYASRIAAETERYWCGIKHKEDPGRIFYPPQHHHDFLPYDDAAALKKLLKKKGDL